MADATGRRSKFPLRSVALALALVLSASLAGCGLLESGQDDPDIPSGSEAVTQFEALETVNATATYTAPGASSPLEASIAHRLSDDALYYQYETKDDAVRTRFVSNGSTQWEYNGTSGEALRTTSVSYTTADQMADLIEQLFESARAGNTEEGGTFQADVISLTPGSGETAGGGQETETTYTTAYEGTESMAGREAHVITLERADTDASAVTYTYWIDTEWFYPLKEQRESDSGEGDYTFEFETIEFNSDVPDSRFTFSGEGIEVDRIYERDVTRFDTRSSAQSVVDYDLPEPTVPEGYEFKSATREVNDTYEYVGLTYSSPSGSMAVLVWPLYSQERATPDGTTVSVGDESGILQEGPQQTTVTWECGDRLYQVYSPTDSETTLSVARSIDCG